MRRSPALITSVVVLLALAVPATAATGITATFSRTGTRGKFVVSNTSTAALNGWSIKQKTAWLRGKGMLGAMVWDMSGDTANGTLMNAVATGLP